ncbi:hypothetical protein N8993_11585 [Pseudomonadales bacterium]|nr:hypothetical protein [Pseudomonadales bacterium]MDB2543104.1 hypothetical protein [Pseudomonadales bacterium]
MKKFLLGWIALSIFISIFLSAYLYDESLELIQQKFEVSSVHSKAYSDNLSQVSYQGQLFQGGLSIQIPRSQFSGSYLLEIVIPIDQSASLRGSGGAELFSVEAANCEALNEVLRCKKKYEYQDQIPSEVIVSSVVEGLEIKSLKVTNVQKNLRIWGEEGRVLTLLAVFGFISFFIGTLKSRLVKRNLVLFASLLFVSALSLSLVIFTVIYLFASYFMVRRLVEKKIALAVTVALQIALIILLKFLLPFTGESIFSNGVLLPLGISYLFARQIDLQFKIAKGEVGPCGFFDFFTYNIFWPTFSAGPIAQYAEIFFANERVESFVRWQGIERLALGFAKKALADLFMFVQYSPIYSTALTEPMDPFTLAVLLASNLFYVYIDFSAYSDMAIGSGKMMGVRVPENFKFPIFQSGMRDFWQTWHMSLSNWVNRNVFMPLSLSLRHEVKLVRYVLPLFASMGVIGLWHAPSMTWVMWSVHHAVGLIVTDLFTNQTKYLKKQFNVSDMRVIDAATYIVGVLFVWYWLMLSFCFTLTNNSSLAIGWYFDAMQLPYYLIAEVFAELA